MMTMLPIPKMETQFGKLYEADCMSVLPSIPSDSIDLVFADPPFNLGKEYNSKFNDAIPEQNYILWCQSWLNELVRVLRPGGALFLFNLPKWNLPLGAFLGNKLTFRHWISVDIKYSLPVPKRLYCMTLEPPLLCFSAVVGEECRQHVGVGHHAQEFGVIA